MKKSLDNKAAVERKTSILNPTAKKFKTDQQIKRGVKKALKEANTNKPKNKPKKDRANNNVEVASAGDCFNISMDLPGVELEDINLEVDEYNILITAKNGVRNYKFNRTFNFSLEVNTAKATFKNGVLNVSVEKVTKPDMKKVNIEG